MDPLSDLLRVVRLDGAYFYRIEATAHWLAAVPPARVRTPRILPQSEHLIGYHIVTTGRCFGGLVGESPRELGAGDVILFPHGDAHIMGSEPVGRREAQYYHTIPAPYPSTLHMGDGGPHTATLLCGFLGCDLRPFNPLLASLPAVIHLSGGVSPWIGAATKELLEQSWAAHPGSDGALTRLAELMFIEVVRRYLHAMPPGQTGWLAGLHDEVVGRALALLHARPAHPWTLDALAREAATSRSSLARRFQELMGQPPMQYLTRWRMQVAANLLVQSGAKIAVIASEVGYDSESAFSRAFKQATGVSPGTWREGRRG